MRVKILFRISLLAAALAISCGQPRNNRPPLHKTTHKHPVRLSADAAAGQIKRRKHIDSLIADTSKLIVLVKVPGRDTLLQVKNSNFPDDVETTYNLYKTPEGKVIFAAEIPYSESGDWFIDYESYFDDSGRLVAFVRESSFFDSGCSGEATIHKSLIKYYDKNLQLIDSVYTIRDDKNRPIKNYPCINDYNYPYHIIKRLNDYLKAKHIII